MRPKTIILLTALIISLSGIFTGNVQGQKPRKKTVKQQEKLDYEKAWGKVDSLAKKGLPKSALEVVAAIHDQARSENNAPQAVKSILYGVRLKADFEEDFMKNVLAGLDQDIRSSSFPMTQILHSVSAELFRKYYQDHRYELLDRTSTRGNTAEDIATWDLSRLVSVTRQHYLLSLDRPVELQGIPLKLYDAMLEPAENSKLYRPTLYDFLAHRALEFFSEDPAGLIQPASRFEVNDPVYFRPAAEFIRLGFKAEDTASSSLTALKLFRDLLVFHLGDKDPSALIDADLERIRFVYAKASFDEKDSLYLDALVRLEQACHAFPASAEVSFQIASFLSGTGDKYRPLVSGDHKWDRKEALGYCEDAIRRFPASDGAENCRILASQIRAAALDLTTPAQAVPAAPFLGLLAYRNAAAVYFRILSMDPEKERGMKNKYNGSERIKKYLEVKPLKAWSLTLPDDRDYQQHQAEVKLPGLLPGYYVVLVSNDPDFKADLDDKKSTEKTNPATDTLAPKGIGYHAFWVTGISYLSRQKDDGEIEYFVLDRETGEPLKNAVVKTYYSEYNYRSRSYETTHGRDFSTNQDGYFMIPKNDARVAVKPFYLDFSYGNDRYITENFFHQYNSKIPKTSIKKTFFFTDRSIYRPGQTVYFKGILLETDGDSNRILANYRTTVTFYDVNGKSAGSLDLVTNEYGSVAGAFTAPSGVLTGQMRISNDLGTAYFRVEEYKRPKFEVVFEPVTGSYKLGETVTVKGTARAYAGNPVDLAGVKFRVVRKAHFPYWGYFWRSFCPVSPSMEITNGNITTDEKGEFVIRFKAIPDRNVNSRFKPVFDYEVTADVTDLNGETRTGSRNVSVSNTALLINLDIPEEMNREEKQSFSFRTTNLNGEPEAARVKVSAWALRQPDRIFRPRQWDRPDKFTMTQDEYYASFPHDQYDNESDVSKWEQLQQVFTKEMATPADSVLSLENISGWEPGTYALEALTTDRFGTQVESRQFFTLYSLKAKQVPEPALAWISLPKNLAEPGDNLTLLAGSRLKGTRLLLEVANKGNVVRREWIEPEGQVKAIVIPVTEACRGNFSVSLAGVRLNRSFGENYTIRVPFTNKALDITFETFRSKLVPGQDEEWKIRIRGKKGEKVAAEMLAAMYDASLDAFLPHRWNFDLYRISSGNASWERNYAFATASSNFMAEPGREQMPLRLQHYDQLNWFGMNMFAGRYGFVGGEAMMDGGGKVMRAMSAKAGMDDGVRQDMMAPAANVAPPSPELAEASEKPEAPVLSAITPRKNFNETAFFYPQMQSDPEGNLVLKFTLPESLTRWKMTGLAHTKDLKYGQIEKELVAQKDLMVMPNAPRYLREGDTLCFAAKISNTGDKDLEGTAQLQFFDAVTMQPADALIGNHAIQQSFKAAKGSSTSLSWRIIVPATGLQAVTYRIVASAGEFSDGEEAVLPVLTNRMLVIESLPLPIRGMTTKTFRFEKLLNSRTPAKGQTGITAVPFRLTLEFSSNPAWYAIQALPYLMEAPYENADAVFSRFYANSIAASIANSNPKIKRVFDAWSAFTPEAFLSNLEKNQDLKSVVLEETPWVMDARGEQERKQRVALLFDLNRMTNELDQSLRKLDKMQSSNGGWPWFAGMPESRYITQHIVTGLGHLDHLGLKRVRQNDQVWNMTRQAVSYLDERIREDYDALMKQVKEPEKDHLGQLQIHYLYARTYFTDFIEIPAASMPAFEYYSAQARKYWTSQTLYMQGMIALALFREGDAMTPSDILNSLREKALHSEETGMYWRDLVPGYRWFDAPVETQSLLIEAFDEIGKDKQAVEEMKTWLLKQKQTQDWRSTRATAEACYALLLRGTDILASDRQVEITLGNKIIDPRKDEGIKAEAGTGYFKTSWSGKEIIPDMGRITVTKADEGVAWGAVYYQYFEQLDKITPAATPLALEKNLFLEKNSPAGPVLEPLGEKTVLRTGDKVVVRIVLRVDRDLEYIHMKDMRASGLEPVNVLSQYKFQGGLGYYESTRDAATHFFFPWLPKGTYVFEYPLTASVKGEFSNGITTVQCMYAPEFSSHSEGIRVRIE